MLVTAVAAKIAITEFFFKYYGDKNLVCFELSKIF